MSLLTALLVLSAPLMNSAAASQISETSGTGDISFLIPAQWVVSFLGNNTSQINLADYQEQAERRYVADGYTLGESTPTHATFVTPIAPYGYFYRFDGWNTERNGNGESFTHSQVSTFPITRHMRFYAQWALERELVTEPRDSDPLPAPDTQPTTGEEPLTPPDPLPEEPVDDGEPTAATPDTVTPTTTNPAESEPEAVAEDIEDETIQTLVSADNTEEPTFVQIEDAESPRAAINLTDEETPLLGGIPLYAQKGIPTWALLNLILAALGIIITVLAILRRTIAANRKQREEMERTDASGTPSESFNKGVMQSAKSTKSHKTLWLIVGSVAAVLSIVLFILFQDLEAIMVWVDYWTIAHILLFTLGIISAILATRGDKYRDDSGDTEELVDTQKSQKIHI